MNPLICEDEFSIEINKIFDDDFQKVHPIIFELGAKVKHVVKVEHMCFYGAKFMRVIFFKTLNDGLLIV